MNFFAAGKKNWCSLLACGAVTLAIAWMPTVPARAASSAAADAATAKSYAKRMQWFGDAKFGIFIHWGIYSVDGVGESWSFYNGHIPYDRYMDQLKGFTASHYDPQAWADLVKASGARYAVMTTKHHDGVALWPSKQGINVVRDTPAARDVLTPFVKALREDGLKVGLYFSLIDWSYKDYPAHTKTEKRYQIKDDPARWQRFRDYYQAQVHDLTRRYHPDLYWFDGGWEHSAKEWQSRKLHDWMLAHNPGAIMNSRLPEQGDYGTPEQGPPIQRPPYRYWELCLTMNDSWGWQPGDHAFKSPDQLIRILTSTAGMGGNLLLDIGPRADGSIPDVEVKTLKAIGRWLGRNGKAIYGTLAGVPKDYYAGNSTLSSDRKTLYLFVNGDPQGPVLLKGLINHVLSAHVVGDDQPLQTRRLGATLGGVPSLLYIDVPNTALDPQHVTAIALQLDSPIDLYHDTGEPNVLNPDEPTMRSQPGA